MSKKKAIAATAFLTTLMTLGIITPIFWFKNNASPLSTSIVVQFVYTDGTTPIEDLSVELKDGALVPIQTLVTDSSGKVTFTGLEDETYTWMWSWQGIEASHSEPIDCSQIVWEFPETLDYWSIEKTFVYEITETPIVGLTVELRSATAGQIAIPLDTEITDESGLVTFVGLKAGDYTIEWTWGGAYNIEPVSIVYTTTLDDLKLTNYVGLKSWWRQ